MNAIQWRSQLLLLDDSVVHHIVQIKLEVNDPVPVLIRLQLVEQSAKIIYLSNRQACSL